ncbi:DUF3107 domain-containing protein [Corynebacterium sp. TAE3-ERU12]|uniref:DUF3107 domain-containing protein n=1 Tax=Corynebacterium sp. TAE3-ERU12 TaxID=2849491 RepID=UPI001C4374E8|nr:DUF3107 domain-containing protein [Corynebacterium sp. TAE3-ERU12]MBV7294838.1 DUF3107 domain-containing protein [Corynebacterium sp. TAE3-ERU12]
MDITFGFVNVPRELTVTGVRDGEEARERINSALTSGTGVIELTDNTDRRHLVRVEHIAYVQFGPAAARKVGFVS